MALGRPRITIELRPRDMEDVGTGARARSDAMRSIALLFDRH
jgi:hypothetical protein